MTEIKSVAALAFNTIESRLLGTAKAKLSQYTQFDSISLPSSAPLFVSWHKRGNLRGCIGTFNNLPLEEGVRQYTNYSAFNDNRFSKITSKELKDLDVCVTLLGPMEEINDITNWTIGVHGIRGEFKNGTSATYLPEVAEEQGWDHEDTILSLADKAGSRTIKDVKLWRYEGLKSQLTYSEYKQLIS